VGCSTSVGSTNGCLRPKQENSRARHNVREGTCLALLDRHSSRKDPPVELGSCPHIDRSSRRQHTQSGPDSQTQPRVIIPCPVVVQEGVRTEAAAGVGRGCRWRNLRAMVRGTLPRRARAIALTGCQRTTCHCNRRDGMATSGSGWFMVAPDTFLPLPTGKVQLVAFPAGFWCTRPSGGDQLGVTGWGGGTTCRGRPRSSAAREEQRWGYPRQRPFSV